MFEKNYKQIDKEIQSDKIIPIPKPDPVPVHVPIPVPNPLNAISIP